MTHWTRGQTLGSGGFGIVSMAKTHRESNLPAVIAVKSAKLSDSTSLSAEKKLLDEFKSCPCILRCFGDNITKENGEQFYNILLEYASGGSVADHIGKGMPQEMVSRYTKSVLTALSHIHKLGYVHCDIKPHNILLFQDNIAKLADFGSCSKMCDLSTDKNSFRGTVVYSAPESISRQQYVPESDVWALGCTVLQMVTGKSVWVFDKNVEAKDVLFKIGCTDDIPEIPNCKKVSKECRDFLKKCFVKDPTARWNADMLLDHPFLKMDNLPPARKFSHRHQYHHHHHHFSSRLSHGIHSLVPHCFHVSRTAAVVRAAC